MKFATHVGIVKYSFHKAHLEVKVVRACHKVLLISQYAVHEYHVREAEILWFLDLIDACSCAETPKELLGHINNMSIGNFLLLRNALPLRHLKLGKYILNHTFK